MGFLDGSEVKNSPLVQETQETQVGYLGWEDPLEEGRATHSSILAWKIPQTEEPTHSNQRVAPCLQLKKSPCSSKDPTQPKKEYFF